MQHAKIIKPTTYDTSDPLFKDRVPEAAARQLAIVVAWLTETELANLEAMQMRSRVRKGELARQIEICDRAVRHCFELGVSPSGLRGITCLRLSDRLKALRDGLETPPPG